MPTITRYESDASAVQSRLELLEWLERTFSTGFQCAVQGPDREWRIAAVEDTPAANGPLLDVEVIEACDAVMDTRAPQVLAHEGDECIVALPMPGDTPSSHVAFGEVTGVPVDLLQRMADLWLTASQANQQAKRFQSENEYFAEQLSEDLEELTFLRSMVEHLDVSDTSSDLLGLAESTLPLLNQTVKAECLAVLLIPEGNKPHEAEPTLCMGPNCLNDAVLTRIVRWFGASALDQPVVKNRLGAMPDGERMSGVREFILVPLSTRSHQMGWLLAINRLWPSGNRPSSEWALSQFEFGTAEATLLSTTASVLATHASNRDLFREKENILISVVRSLVSAVDAKDEYTCGHSERVALYGRILAEEVGYDETACERLYLTGLLHDVGKIGVSDAVLKKAGKLTDEEFDEIKRHPDEGWAILHDLEQLRYVLPGVLYHHERIDGAGYPDGLKGESIPTDGRLLAIVDAYDAMTSDRPYREGMPPQRAQEILRSGAGSQWDAVLVDAFFRAIDKIEHVRQNYVLRKRPVRDGVCDIPGSLTD